MKSRQDEVLAYLRTVEKATLREIYDNVSFSYYANWNKHLSALMARMVKNEKVERSPKRRGTFRAKRKVIYSQLEMFGEHQLYKNEK